MSANEKPKVFKLLYRGIEQIKGAYALCKWKEKDLLANYPNRFDSKFFKIE